jgi:hypothetical protein
LSSNSSVVSTRRRTNVLSTASSAASGQTGAGTAGGSGFTTELAQNAFKFSNRNASQLEELVSEGLSLRIDFSDEILALQQVLVLVSFVFLIQLNNFMCP